MPATAPNLPRRFARALARTLFGLLWPLGESVKLDSTIDRRTLRAQIARLGELGYALDFKTQEWSRQAEPQAA